MSERVAGIEPEELPAPSAEMVLLRVLAEAFLATSTPKRARAFMNVATSILADEESLSLAFPIRPASRQPEITKARRGAVAMYRQLLPTLMARVPPR